LLHLVGEPVESLVELEVPDDEKPYVRFRGEHVEDRVGRFQEVTIVRVRSAHVRKGDCVMLRRLFATRPGSLG
jgi:hypothetical protein